MIKIIQNRYLVTMALILVIVVAFFLAWVLLDDGNNNFLSHKPDMEKPALEPVSIVMPHSAAIRLPQGLAPLDVNVVDLPVIILADDFTIVTPDYRQPNEFHGG
jgi:hypothetical protein